MRNWSWKEGLIFVFARKLLPAEEIDLSYGMSFGERLGSQILKPIYYIIEFVSKNIRMPLAICLFTLLAALIIGFTFYNIPAFVIFAKLFPIELVRFVFFIYGELNLFAIGCTAFGRFNNKQLIDLWKNGRLIAVMPGDYKVRNQK
jgi:hypothetical protein